MTSKPNEVRDAFIKSTIEKINALYPCEHLEKDEHHSDCLKCMQSEYEVLVAVNRYDLDSKQAEIDTLKEALRCYRINYPCPGPEVGTGAGETTGCKPIPGYPNDCPICEVKSC